MQLVMMFPEPSAIIQQTLTRLMGLAGLPVVVGALQLEVSLVTLTARSFVS